MAPPSGPFNTQGPNSAVDKKSDLTMMKESHQSESMLEMPTSSESIAYVPAGNRGALLTPPGRPEPHRHPTTTRKILDWQLQIHKSTVIFGSSNLSRIPKFFHPDIQIDSFPGATFHHLNHILKKLPPQPTPKKVIISAGLNNCLQLQTPTTTWKQLQQLLKTAKYTFPSATIYIPVINFSPKLTPQQQNLLHHLNNIILSRCTFLTEINPLLFHTEDSDPIHWTPSTARTIFEHWLSQLNY